MMKNDNPILGTYMLILLLLYCACSGTLQNNQDSTPIKDVYQDDFLIGTAVNEEIASGIDSLSTRIVIRNFNTITPENVMKAESLVPSPGVYDFEKADAFVAFGLQHNMKIIAHTLVWHNQCPKWFFESEDGTRHTPDSVKTILRDYIQAVAGRYHGKVHAWDVVNEVIADDGSYRPTHWVNGIGDGDELVRLAFRYAAQYSPDTELYYNDFNAWKPGKRDGIFRMVKMLQAEGIRIDGIGMQGHWGLNYPENQLIEDAIQAYAALGIKVMITELDVDVLPLTKEGQIIGTGLMHEQFQEAEFKKFLDPYAEGLPQEMDNQLAARYRALFEIFFKHRVKIDRVTFWGVHDGMSWKNDYPIPGRTNYPLLWDRDKNAKSALSAIINLKK